MRKQHGKTLLIGSASKSEWGFSSPESNPRPKNTAFTFSHNLKMEINPNYVKGLLFRKDRILESPFAQCRIVGKLPD